MRSPSLAPTRDPVHLVLCDFGRLGLAYAETAPITTEAEVVENILHGQYDKPVEVVAFSTDEGWARDVSKDIAVAVVARSRSEEIALAAGARAFVQKHLDEDLHPYALRSIDMSDKKGDSQTDEPWKNPGQNSVDPDNQHPIADAAEQEARAKKSQWDKANPSTLKK
jgi:hypothetical protein